MNMVSIFSLAWAVMAFAMTSEAMMLNSQARLLKRRGIFAHLSVAQQIRRYFLLR